MVRFVGDSATTIPFVAVATFKGFTLTTIFEIVCAVLSVVTLFSFKNRVRQIRLCNLNTLILIGYQIIIAVYFFQRNNPDKPLGMLLSSSGESPIFTIPSLFPICAAILTFIAMRYIARDEAMVIASTRLAPADAATAQVNNRLSPYFPYSESQYLPITLYASSRPSSPALLKSRQPFSLSLRYISTRPLL